MLPPPLQVELSNFHYVLRLCHRSSQNPFHFKRGWSVSPLSAAAVDNAITKRGQRRQEGGKEGRSTCFDDCHAAGGAAAAAVATLVVGRDVRFSLDKTSLGTSWPARMPSSSTWLLLSRRWQCPSRHPLCFPSARPHHRQQQQQEGAGGIGGVERARYCAGQGSVDTAQGASFCSLSPP